MSPAVGSVALFAFVVLVVLVALWGGMAYAVHVRGGIA